MLLLCFVLSILFHVLHGSTHLHTAALWSSFIFWSSSHHLPGCEHVYAGKLCACKYHYALPLSFSHVILPSFQLLSIIFFVLFLILSHISPLPCCCFLKLACLLHTRALLTIPPCLPVSIPPFSQTPLLSVLVLSSIFTVHAGGKCIDAGKLAAYKCSIPSVVVPTLASTDAPCSALSVMYHPDGTFNEVVFYPDNPYAVIVDTQVIVEAPKRFLLSGELLIAA